MLYIIAEGIIFKIIRRHLKKNKANVIIAKFGRSVVVRISKDEL